MREVAGLNIPQSLEEIISPRNTALIVYDMQVGIVGQDGVLGLTFTLPLSAWNGNEDADKRNRAFLDAFMAAQPDYQAVFPFLVAQALKPDGTPAYRTLHVAGIGYR